MQPYFYSFSEFLAMGKHGVFVWSCWGITLAVVVSLIWYSRQQRKQLLKALSLQQTRQHKRNQNKRKPNKQNQQKPS